MNTNRFIPFSNYVEQASEEIKTDTTVIISEEERQQKLMQLAIRLTVESAKLLESVLLKNDNISEKSELLHELIYSFRDNFSTQSPTDVRQKDYSDYIADILQNDLQKQYKKTDDRSLENGGMAPPKQWKSITELNLKATVMDSIVEEMRRMKDEGKTISKSSFHHKSPLTIEEFTEPFKFLEKVNDYNGSFLVTLLKSDMDISNQAATFQIDLSKERDACLKGDLIILSMFDILGSVSNKEEKKFITILNFDKLNGTLKAGRSIFMNDKNYQLSTRQKAELNKFFNTKKIIY